MLHTWIVSLNRSEATTDENQIGLELDLADPDTLSWESKLVEIMLGKQEQYKEETGVKLFAHAHRR